MMGEEKFASLSSGLLARKGAAKPAMRRQGFINPQGDVTEDLGWNDMGFESPQPIDGDTEYHDEAPLPEVRKQQDQLAEGLNGADHAPLDPIVEQPSVAFDEEPESQDSERYHANGHGGLTPMEPIASEADEVEDEFEPDEVDQDELPTSAADEGVRAHGQSPLSIKNADREESQDDVEPMEQDVPAREKVAFTLRLDKERHLKLRLASAVTNQSAQRLVTEALDKFLEEHPEVQALTGPMSAANKH